MIWRLSAAAAAGPGRTSIVAADGRVVADAVRLTLDSAARRQGLLGLDALPESAALVVVPTQGIHTFGMRFAIDVVFVDRGGRILRICSNVPPRRLRWALRAAAAVELSAGRADRAGLRVGQALSLVVSPA